MPDTFIVENIRYVLQYLSSLCNGLNIVYYIMSSTNKMPPDSLTIRLSKTILHDIRNMKLLTKKNIEDIQKMSSNEKMEIIITYDSVVEHLLQLIDDLG